MLVFRLKSVIAGAAKRGSERLKTLEEDTKKIITTEAARVGKDMEDVRKQRVKDVTSYNQAGRKLRGYGLNNAQVEAVLAGGIDGFEELKSSLTNAELRATMNGVEFNRDEALANLLPEITAGVEGRSLQEQAQAFAAAQSPFESSFDEGVARIGNAVAGFTRGDKAPTDYIRTQLDAQARAFGGARPADFTGQTIGEGTGFQFRPDLTSTEALQATMQAEATRAGTQAQTEGTLVSTARDVAMLPLDVEKRNQEIQSLASERDLTDAQTGRMLTLLPTEVELSKAKVNQITADIEKTNAVIEQMGIENEQIKENTALIQEKVVKLGIESDILGKYGEQEMRAQINQINSSVAVNRKNAEMIGKKILNVEAKDRAEIERITTATATEKLTQEKLQEDINLLEQFGVKEKQAGLDLILSKIAVNESASRPADLEAFQVFLLDENKKLEDTLLQEGMSGSPMEAEIQNQITANNDRIAYAQIALAEDGQGYKELLSKGQAPNVFNTMLKTNLQGFDVQQEFTSLDGIIANIGEGKRPQYFAGLIQTAREFQGVYGMDVQGEVFAYRKMDSINNTLADYYNRLGVDDKRDADKKIKNPNTQDGAFTLEQLRLLPDSDIEEGSVVKVKNQNATGEIEHFIFTGGQFVGVYSDG